MTRLGAVVVAAEVAGKCSWRQSWMDSQRSPFSALAFTGIMCTVISKRLVHGYFSCYTSETIEL